MNTKWFELIVALCSSNLARQAQLHCCLLFFRMIRKCRVDVNRKLIKRSKTGTELKKMVDPAGQARKLVHPVYKIRIQQHY